MMMMMMMVMPNHTSRADFDPQNHSTTKVKSPHPAYAVYVLSALTNFSPLFLNVLAPCPESPHFDLEHHSPLHVSLIAIITNSTTLMMLKIDDDINAPSH